MKVTSEHDRVKALCRALASVKVNQEFAEIGHSIYGSQMDLLLTVTSGAAPTSNDEAKKIYSNAATAFPEIYKNKPFEEWLGYLKAVDLIIIDGPVIDITQYGADFLKSLVDNRKTYPRRG